MDEIAGATINGLFCEICGAYIDGHMPGYPRKCRDCEKDEDREKNNRTKKRGG